MREEVENPMVTGYGFYEPPRIVYTQCKECGEDIYEGEDFYVPEGLPMCEPCNEKRNEKARRTA